MIGPYTVIAVNHDFKTCWVQDKNRKKKNLHMDSLWLIKAWVHQQSSKFDIPKELLRKTCVAKQGAKFLGSFRSKFNTIGTKTGKFSGLSFQYMQARFLVIFPHKMGINVFPCPFIAISNIGFSGGQHNYSSLYYQLLSPISRC